MDVGNGIWQRLVQHQPTQHPTSGEFSIGKIKFKAFDLRAHQDCSKCLESLLVQDRFLIKESKKELDALLSDEALTNLPFIILDNKIDIPYTASEGELRYHLGLTNFTTGKGKVNLGDSNVRPH